MRRIASLLIAGTTVLAACGPADVPPAAWPETLPASGTELAEIFDPVLEPYGYRITRAALVERSTYLETPDGDHLALYASPAAYLTADEYATDLPQLVQLFLPHVFEQWPQLASFDICQEPQESSTPVAPSLTIFDITRAAAEGVAWESVALSDLIALDDRDGVSVYARPVVADSATWETARREHLGDEGNSG